MGMRNKQLYNNKYKWLLFGFDALLINACYWLAFIIRFGNDIPNRNIEPFMKIIPFTCLATIIVFITLGLYEQKRYKVGFVLRSLFVGVITVGLCTSAISFWARGFAFPRTVIVIGTLLQLIILPVWHLILWKINIYIYGRKELVIIGNVNDINLLIEKILNLPTGWFEVKKVLDITEIDQLSNLINKVDTVIIASTLPREEKSKTLSVCRESNVELLIIPDYEDIILSKKIMSQLDDMPILEIEKVGLTMSQKMFKRTFDIIVSLIGLLIMSPLVVVCVITIRLNSKGPIIYTQYRVGENKRLFKIYKFRTMVKNAEELTGPIIATKDDQRITTVGKYLRATRLDELPQLINVLKGEMSVIGPRPERPVFTDKYELENPYYKYRNLVKPGITGLAQIVGKYTTTPDDKLKYDLYYICKYSFMSDLRILLRTLPVLLNSESSSGVEKSNKINTCVKY